MAIKPTIHRVIELHKLLLKFRAVERVVHIKKGEDVVRENDVEHSYFLAITAWFLADYFPNLDRDLVIRLALAHDLVEIHAGDTYAFADTATISSKQKREADAFRKLLADWPDFKGLTDSIDSYEALNSPEACFVYALDKIMPIIAIYINNGYTWQNEKLTLSTLHDNKKPKTAASPEISEYYDQLYALLKENDHLFHQS